MSCFYTCVCSGDGMLSKHCITTIPQTRDSLLKRFLNFMYECAMLEDQKKRASNPSELMLLFAEVGA